ncbi:MAG TPA: CAP domain-containing protein [Draconibacterium sp.]|nr:CAP domain-containing protein [Draconibacterium sp.]
MKRIWGWIILLGLSKMLTAGEVDKDILNTAKSATYLSPLEKEVIYEINLFRSDPANYSRKYIEPLKKQYDKKILHYPGDNKPICTVEGVRALNECVQELKRMSARPLLYPNNELSMAARDHQRDQQRSGKTGHVGNNGSKMKDRVEKYGRWLHLIGENIAYGNTSARQIVVFLLIDDGVKDRGHRSTLLNPDFSLVGVACGSHPVYETMCVLDFAGGMAKE